MEMQNSKKKEGENAEPKKSFAAIVASKVSLIDPFSQSTRTEKKSFEGSSHMGIKGMHHGKMAIKFSDNETEMLATPFKYSLVGKFSHGIPKPQAIQKKLQEMQFSGNFFFGYLNFKHILIRLTNEDDYTYAWTKLSAIDGFPIRVLKWTKSFNVRKEEPVAPVWMKLPELPVHFFNKNALYSIASLVGVPLRIDEATSDLRRPSVARVCVEVNLQQPLIKEILIGQGEEMFLQQVIFENCPSYCSFCQHIGHKEQDCYKKNRKANVQETGDLRDTINRLRGDKEKAVESKQEWITVKGKKKKEIEQSAHEEIGNKADAENKESQAKDSSPKVQPIMDKDVAIENNMSLIESNIDSKDKEQKEDVTPAVSTSTTKEKAQSSASHASETKEKSPKVHMDTDVALETNLSLIELGIDTEDKKQRENVIPVKSTSTIEENVQRSVSHASETKEKGSSSVASKQGENKAQNEDVTPAISASTATERVQYPAPHPFETKGKGRSSVTSKQEENKAHKKDITPVISTPTAKERLQSPAPHPFETTEKGSSSTRKYPTPKEKVQCTFNNEVLSLSSHLQPYEGPENLDIEEEQDENEDDEWESYDGDNDISDLIMQEAKENEKHRRTKSIDLDLDLQKKQPKIRPQPTMRTRSSTRINGVFYAGF